MTFLSALLISSGLMAQTSVETERQYLSGRGCDDMVQWDFYCTGGNNSGKWTKIGVPSCWELQCRWQICPGSVPRSGCQSLPDAA